MGAAVTAGYQARVAVIHTRFQGNRARQAAAIFIGSDGDLTIVDSAFVDNSAWDDGAITGSHVIQLVPSGARGGTTPCVTGATVITTDPAPLPAAPADNGGPTWTILPAAGSPLIGAGAGCEQTDQRGKARDTARCTVGAVEP